MPSTTLRSQKNWTRKSRGRCSSAILYAIGGVSFLCTFVVYYVTVLFTHRALPSNTQQPDHPLKHIVLPDTTILPQRPVHPLEHIVKMKHGPSPGTWELVDWSNPISLEEEQKFSCEMTNFVASASGQQAKMCVHTFSDFISNAIKGGGRYVECDILPNFMTQMKDGNAFYIDIGANIGSCVMEMLMSTKANIVAFEPHPMNAYNIKKTVSKLGKEYQDRMLLFPIGLGNIQSNTTIYSGSENMGNSQLGKMVKDWDHQEFREDLQFTAFIERLDSVLDETKINNTMFVKMDTQGFECNAIDGMGSLSKKIEIMRFEYSPRFLDAQGCTDLVPKMKALGFNVYDNGGFTTQKGAKLQQNPPSDQDYELLAAKPVA